MPQTLYVQYGCGFSAPNRWRNFDASPTLRYERLPLVNMLYRKNENRFPSNIEYGDIVKGLPIASVSCTGIYCSHVLEHLTLNDCRLALQNTYFMLKPNGCFRFVLPDLEFYIHHYLQNPAKDAAIDFMRDTYLGYEKRVSTIWDFVVSIFGNSRHLWMWDYKSIESELLAIGFINIRRAHYGDSDDPFYNDVEDKSRWDNCLGIECIKPPN